MNSREIRDKILQLQQKKNAVGSFFSVVNRKKDGTLRKYNCRLGVKKHLQGGELRFDPDEKNMLVVWDNLATGRGYRMVNCSTIIDLQVCGIKLVKNGKKQF